MQVAQLPNCPICHIVKENLVPRVRVFPLRFSFRLLLLTTHEPCVQQFVLASLPAQLGCCFEAFCLGAPHRSVVFVLLKDPVRGALPGSIF